MRNGDCFLGAPTAPGRETFTFMRWMHGWLGLAAVTLFVCGRDASCQPIFNTGQSADLMLSGVGFNDSGGALVFNHPSGIASDGTHFLLCDRFNNRVLIWNSLPSVWSAQPDLVLGQTNFTTNDPGTGKGNLNWPGNVSVSSNGVVAVADTENDRILIWNSFPTQNGQAADVSIYLPMLTTPGHNRLEWPWGVWTDGTRLAAVATHGEAILFWNTLPILDDTPQAYTIRNAQFGTPRNISTDGSTYFFVGDHNCRIYNGPGTYFWNSYPSLENQPYDFVRQEWIKGTKLTGSKLGAGGSNSAYIWNTVPTTGSISPDLTVTNSYYGNGDGPDVVYAGGRMYVNNYNGNNVQVYNTVPTTSGVQPDFALGSSSIGTNTLSQINYIQNPVVATDGTHLLASSDFDKAVWIWKSIPTQSGSAPDVKISLVGQNISPWDNALHNGRFVAAGKQSVAVWDSLPLNGESPSRLFSGILGGVTFQEIRGVALDASHLYLADTAGSIYAWNGIPANNSVAPVRTINTGSTSLNHLDSDGTYLCAASQGSPSAVYIYKVADVLAGGTITPWKTILPTVNMKLNLPSSAIAFGGALAIASTGTHAVFCWKNIAEAGDDMKVVSLGQSTLSSIKPAIGTNRLFMPGSLAVNGNRLWVGEFKFSSRIVRFTGMAGVDGWPIF